MGIKDNYKVIPIQYEHCKDWLLKKHYARRIPSISYAFGLYYIDNTLRGVMTIGKPASTFICVGVCGEEYADYVYEFNRLCITEPHDRNIPSYFVGNTLKLLKKQMILVSYADTKWNHIGYIYQATNWIYTGITKKVVDRVLVGSNSHARHNNIYEIDSDNYECVDRSQKHRYIYFVGTKNKVVEMKNKLRYQIMDYPKGDNKRYDASYEPQIQGMLL